MSSLQFSDIERRRSNIFPFPDMQYSINCGITFNRTKIQRMYEKAFFQSIESHFSRAHHLFTTNHRFNTIIPRNALNPSGTGRRFFLFIPPK